MSPYTSLQSFAADAKWPDYKPLYCRLFKTTDVRMFFLNGLSDWVPWPVEPRTLTIRWIPSVLYDPVSLQVIHEGKGKIFFSRDGKGGIVIVGFSDFIQEKA